MKKTIKNLSIIILVISLLLLPFLGFGILLGLSGSASKYFLIIATGYIGVIISSLVSIFKYKIFPIVLISIALIVLGITPGRIIIRICVKN